MDDAARATLAERAAIAKADTMQQHVLLCGAADCGEAGDPAAALRALKHAVAEAGLRREVLVSEAACLKICEQGTEFCVVHPDGTWYAQVDDAVARRIVIEHLVAGDVVADHAFLDPHAS